MVEPVQAAARRRQSPAEAQLDHGIKGRRVAWAKGFEGQRKADLGDVTFLNPIVAGDHPDPTVLKDGEDYYMTFSSFFSYPGPIIWHSRDLVNWTPVGPAVTKPLGSIWAMDFVKHDGRFYIFIPAIPRGEQSIFVIYADDIRGPWSAPIDLKVSGCIDPGHAVGEDGKRYLFFNGVRRIALTDDGLATTGPLQGLAMSARSSCLLCLLIAVAASALAAAQSAQRDEHGITITSRSMLTRVEFWRDDLVRITHRPSKAANPPAVTQPGATSRAVYLPANTGWIDFWTGKSYAGGETITADAPVAKMPIYVRAGAIVPYGPTVDYSDDKPNALIELRVYPGANGDFTLYEDAGGSYDYERGAFATISLHWDDATSTLRVGARQGTFPGLIAERTFRIVRVRPGHGNGVESTEKADAEVLYKGQAITARANP